MIRTFAVSLAAIAVATAVTSAAPAAARPIHQTDLIALERVSDPHVSPDGTRVVYDVATLTADGVKRTHTLWTTTTDGHGQPVKLTEGSNPRWAPDGRRIYFLKAAKGVDQVWSIDADHPDRGVQQVTDLPTDVGAFRISSDGRTLVVSMAVDPSTPETATSIKATLDAQSAKKSSGRLYDHLFVRHWDTWADKTKNHLFALVIGDDGRAAAEPTPLTRGFDGDAPSKPFGGDEDFAITPDGKAVLFSARLAGTTEPWSTNFDVWRTPLDGSAPPKDLTSENKAWDSAPVFSPDGRLSAHRAMKRPGFEADRFGVVVYSDATGKSREIDPTWDRSADQLAFSGDGESLYVLAGDVQTVRIFQMDATSGAVKPLTTGGHVGSFDVAHAPSGDVLVFTRDTMAAPPEVYALRPGGQPVQLTHVTAPKLAGLDMSAYESFTFKGWNKDVVHGWVVKPAGYHPGRKYPTVFLIHGGPQGSWEDSWSWRWNPQVWAGWGYAVVMVDPHASTGYGQAFTDAVSGHWGDRPLEDLKKGWAAAQAKFSFVDGSRACAAGASYGGFMVYWIEGVWSRPWKCLIDHDGVFDNRIMGYATEELWFSQWENGHTPVWENPANYERFNPINHVAAWTKPMLVIHSDKDFRIPLDQGIGAFTALQRKGVPSQFLNFPDENHWVLKPQNSLMWHNTVEAWLKRWIG